jgi:anthranilate 1,2-dioxygenase (deaminating, decarboxylating) large subunit
MKRFIITFVIIAALAGSTVRAYELPPVNLGFTSFLDGAPPAGHGLYFAQYFQYYFSDDFQNNPVLKSENLNAWVSLSQLIYQSDKKVFLGGKWGLDLIVPVVGVYLDPETVPVNSPGFADMTVGPFLQWDPIMGKNGPVFVHRIEIQCIVPSGRWDNDNAVNTGSNIFSLDPYWAATWFPTSKCELSLRAHYLWNDTNDDPYRGTGLNTLQPGQAVHFNLASSYEILPKHLRLGVNAYYLKQITRSEGDGNKFGGMEQVLGVGPGGLYSFSQNDHIFFNVYFETCVAYRTEGTRFNLRWVHHF